MLTVTGLSNDYSVKDTADRYENKDDDWKLDISLYPKLKDAAYELSKDHRRKSRVQDARKPYLAHTIWAWLVFFLEVKSRKNQQLFTQEPISGSKGSFKFALSSTKEGQKARAQMAKYAAEIFRKQHRVCVFTVSVAGYEARFMRWDRVGVVVSTVVEYMKDPAPLLNFVYRLLRGGAQVQGYDTTARLATEEEVKALAAFGETPMIADNKWAKEYVHNVLSNKKKSPIYKV